MTSSLPWLQPIATVTVTRLQEQVGDDRREAGRIPRTIDCELTGDLVDSCVPGDIVTVTAVVKATGSHDDSMPITRQSRAMYSVFRSAAGLQRQVHFFVVSFGDICRG